MKILRYSDLVKLDTFEERFEYLKLNGIVGARTFSSHRYLNQALYHSPEWKRLKNQIIVRDNGCDLGVPGHSIRDRIYIHHLNPISIDDVINRNKLVMDEENLICTTFNTHQAIHYGDKDLLSLLVERKPGDTKLW